MKRHVAIVGAACRFPGDAVDLDGYWRLLDGRIDAVREVPVERWDPAKWLDPNPDVIGKTYSARGTFVSDIDRFDAWFFQISPREAKSISPEQRLLLEVSWEAIENAGLLPERIREAGAGVFVGVAPTVYGDTVEGAIPPRTDVYAVTGRLTSFGAGRLSYVLGFRGPSVAIDTACSSALVALHLACRSLQAGECAVAVASAVNVLLNPISYVDMSRLRALSRSGACRAFDAMADGYVRGEGCGAVVLKLLDDALRDGDHVLAVIRGSAVNHDGASSGLTVPSRHAQEELLRAALRDAELAPSDIDYVEAHGTGTPLGDPIEALALGTVFGEGRPADRPLLFGSVKTNLGHLESAAGMASLLKLIVALRHEQLPAQLHLQTPNPAIPWAALPMRVAAEPHAWPRRSGRPRLAGLSAFGISGTNAHIILEEPPLIEQAIAPVATVHSVMRAEPSTLPVLISAKSKAALQAQAARIHGFFEAHPDTRLVDFANSLATTRTHFEERAVVVADDRAALLEGLTAVAKGAPCSNVTTGQVQLPGKLVFVFPGQGSQWTEMAHRLLDTSSVFREHIERCAQALAPHVDWSLVDVLLGTSGAPSLERIDVVQPVLFAMAVSLAAVWRSLGIEPDVVVGHSQGEIAAACVAGALSLEDAARVVALRASVLARLDGKGAMAAVELPLPELGERLARFGARLCVSAVNGPRSMIVSGEPQALDELLAELQAAEIFARKVRVDYASHCPQIEAIREDFVARVGSICPRASNVPLCSTVTGDIVEGSELDVDYWYRNCRQEVRFADAIQKLISSGHRFFVEISAHPVLTLAINANIEASGKEAATVGSLRRDQGDWQRFMLSLGELHARGYPVDWTAFFSRFDPRRLTLPTYAFQRKRFWLEPPKTKGPDNAPVGVTAGEHPLVGAVIALAESDGVLLTGQLSLAKHRWLHDHVVFDSAVLPATGFLELALAAAEHVGVDGVDELTIEVPLVLPQDGAIQFQLWVGAKEETGRRPWSLHGRLDKAGEDAAWIRHATGLVGPSEPLAGSDLRAWPPPGATTVPVEGFYERLAAAGLRYGESFRGLTAIWRAGSDLYAEVRLPEGSIREASDFALHPALLDAALHPLALLHEVSSDVALPFSWTGVSLHATGASTLRVRISPSDEHGSFALELADGSGEPVASVESLRTRPAARDQVRSAAPATTLYRVEWTALDLASVGGATSARSRRAHWALCGDDSFALAGRLERSGIPLEKHDVLAGLHGSSASVVLLSRPQQNAERLAEVARAATHEVLAIVQAWLADATFASKQLVIVTRRSVATRRGETVRDVAHAAVWGLVRSAQSEHPDRSIVLLDLDEDADVGLLPAALATGEPQLAIRKEGVFVPRLMRAGAVGAVQAHALDPKGTVLITGGTGVLGALFARHLVREHGARHLLLTSRNGAASPGADSLQRELEAAGAHVTIAACDVANRDALANLLATIAPEHPLGAVVHAAGVLDDGVIEALTPERIDRVFEPKVDAAVHLHELTAQLDLSAFVLFSSVAGVSGGPGQGNYAAANAFLDALAQHRHARGLRASSLAWGYWAERSGMTGHLTQADLSRLARLGIERLSTEEGRSLFDVALSRPEPALVPVRINRSALTAAKIVPPLLRALVRPARRAAGTQSPGSGSSLSERLATLSESDQARTVLELVRAETAVVLGARPESIDAKSALKEFGLDSLMAVELRNRLAATTGLRLPATLLFDHPTLGAVARYVGEKLRPAAPVAAHEPLQVAVADEDPIVVIAMSCRYPGGVRSPEELWQLVVDGKDAITDFPTNRGWPSVAEIYDPDPNARGKSYVHNGGFLHDADLFDPGVFGISQREALTIDPQHRLLLEASWEAFERAGIAPSSLDGSPTGVFVGVMFSDYGARLADRAEEHEGYLGLGSAPSVASGRIAYTFGLQGPAVTLDTACSSSLVALHLASHALRLGECSIALAGGVSVMATPGMFIEFSRQRGLAPDGRCKPFAASADGTAWSEGVGMLLLERLSDARRHGHPVLAVIRGSAVNQDGKSQGLTAPNGPSQQRVIAQALTSAGLSPGDIDVVEAHGTGTALGDPIEAEALLATYGEGHTAERPLWLGSVKSNIGHTQAAAGAAGIMKMVLALEHGVLPKSLSAESPSPHVDWSPRTVRLLNEPVSWQPNGKPRRAGISAFGISGTNAHVIIEGPPSTSSVEQGGQRGEPTVLPFVVSARTESALRVQATQLRAHVEARPEERLADIAHSLATTRAHLEWRAVIVASDRSQLVEGLASLAESRPNGAVVCGDAKHVGKLAVLFAGQGSQYVGMGQALYESVPAFREAFDVVCTELDRHLSHPLREVVFASSDSTGASLLHETGFTQPALFALEVALYRLLEAWGITPDFLLGHSVGEISAAHVSGVLDLADACTLIAARGRLMQALPPGGTMVSLRASEEEVASVLAGREDRVSIALLNGPLSTVIAGDEEAVLDVARHFESLGRKTSRLMVSHAFHSPRMDGMLEAFRDVVQGLRFRTPRIPIVSNVTGEVATAEELASPDYWVRHVRRPVRFSDGMRSLEAEGTTTFLELGPRGVLSAMGQECLVGDGGERAVFLPALRDERPELGTLVSAMAGVHARGHALDWNAFFAPFEPHRVALPTYAFERKRFWLDAPRAKRAGAGFADHPLLNVAIAAAEGDAVLFGGQLSLEHHPWFSDHAAFESILVSPAVYVELALAAAERVGLDGVEELTIDRPLVLPEAGGIDIQIWVGPKNEGGLRPWNLHSRPADSREDAAWTRHAIGLVGRTGANAAVALRAWPPPGATSVPTEGLYERLAEAGLRCGEAFRGVTSVWRAGSDLYAEIRLPEGIAEDASSFRLHPALLDAALHPLAALRDSGEVRLPVSWEGVHLYATGASTVRVRITPHDELDSFLLVVADASGEPVATVETVRTQVTSLARIRGAVPATVADSLYRVEWTAVSVANVPNAGGERAPWALLGGDSLGLAGRLEKEGVRLESHGDQAALHGSAAEVVLLCRAQSKTERLEEGARAVTRQVLAIVQAWLADADVASKQLVIVTRRAVATRMNETAEDLAHAAAWGLVRSAQFEHPDRSIVLVDLDDDADVGLLPSALTLGEPQVALRKEGVFVPRLIRAGAVEARTLDLDGTVLITGGTGMLGALFARHLVSAHGARHVLLTSRQGMASPGADRLQRELEAAGAQVTIAACDVANRDALAKLLGTIDRAHPLRAIVHAAGVLDDGVIEALTPERIDRVFVPKVDAAVHLHELTEHLDLAAFVLFSSVAGVAGGPGQGNYAAANAFLDALAQHRRGRGLPASSLAWGYWEERSALTAHLRRADLSRFARMGIRQLSTQEGLALFDLALSRPEPTLVPIRLDWSAIGSATVVPPLLRALVRRARRAVSADAVSAHAERARSAFTERLVTLPQDERARVVFELVRTEIALVLGTKPESIDGASTLKDFGLDSLMAVELRNRLAAATGLRLSATLLFDHPTPAALGRYVEETLRVRPSAVMSPRQPRPVIASDDDPIVIVAMSCRFPGGVRSPEELWQLVLEGKDAIGDFPTNRGWPKLDELYDPDPEARGKSYVRQGGFLHDADQFDSAFFGINQREAMTIDPQHRLLLETSWEAFERAGIAPASLLGSTTGVFVGLNYNGYGVTRWDSAEEYEGYLGIGSAPSVASGRIAYTFGLQGPAMTVDTACSSSLVALHLACQAVRSGECSIALAGGVSVMATPATFIEFSRQRALSPDARCKAFAAGADGTAWSEGVGMLLVERLSDARRNGHPVLAVIRGSAVNQDGKSQGLTAPNGPAQRRVIEQALTNAGLSPSEVDVVEAHGTGTALGDPIEAEALLATYGEGHTAERPLWLGSVKTNIGHTQAAAGAAGIMKMVLALEHGLLPKTLFAESPSPHVDWSPATIRLLNEPVSWPPNGKPRRAAISSFGISGTNAHVIVEGPPAVRPERQAVESVAEPALPFVLSARSENALSAQALQLRAHIEAHPEERLVDIAHALATTRSHFERRAVVVAHDRATLVAGLAALARGEAHPNVVVRRAQSGGKLAFVFPGHGPQWTEMAHRLLDTSSVFREQIERCDRALAPHVEWSLVDVLRGSDGAPSVERLDVVQPALFAMSVALAAVWRSIGIEPGAVVGHSLGEIAAACVAGALSLEEAAKVVALRGLALAKLEGKGMTVAVELSARDVGVRLARYGERITIAGVNGPKSTLVSGEPQAMEEFLSELSTADILGRKVRIDYAAHGSQVDTVRADFIARLGTVNPSATAMGLYSTVTGKEIEGTELDAEYWFENCRKPVCFADAIEHLLSSGYRFFVEASPHPVLTLTIDENIEASGRQAVAIASLRRGQGDWQRLMLSLGELHVAGHPIDWKVFYARFEPRSVSLPTYAFDRKRFWIDALEPERTRVGQASRDLVGRRLSSPLGLIHFEAEWGGAMFSLDDAKSRRLPNALFLELALQAGSRAAQATPMSVVDLRFEHPLVLGATEIATVQTVLSPRAGGEFFFQVFSRKGNASASSGEWVEHASGRLTKEGATPDGQHAREEKTRAFEMAEVVDFMGDARFVMREVWQEGTAACGTIDVPSAAALQRFGAWPFALEAALQLTALLDCPVDPSRVGLLTGDLMECEEVRGHRSPLPPTFMCRVRHDDGIGKRGGTSARYTVELFGGAGEPTATLAGLEWGAVAVRERPKSKTFEERLSEVEQHILERLRELSGYEVSNDSSFDIQSLGLDSLSLMTFMRALEKRYGVRVPVSKMFGAHQKTNADRVRDLARFLLGQEELDASAERESRTSENGAIDYVVLEDAKEVAWPNDQHPLAGIATRRLWRLSEELTIEVAEAGEGPPLVLLPPFACELTVYSAAIRRLKDHHRVIAINYPGYGASSFSEPDATLEAIAAQVKAILVAMKVREPHVLGWSLGGFVAQLLALGPLRDARSLVLVSTTARLDPADSMSGAEELWRQLHTDLETGLRRCQDDSEREAARRAVFGERTFGLSLWAHYGGLVASFDITHSLHEIRVPTLLIHGSNDLPVPLGYAERTHGAIAGSELLVLPEAGHYIPVLAPDVFVDLLTKWTSRF